MGKKKNKLKKHVTYNKKVFVAPESINSMSAIHTKIYEDGTAIIRISDCNGSIRWHNNLNNQQEVAEMICKLTNAMQVIQEFKNEVNYKLNTNISNA